MIHSAKEARENLKSIYDSERYVAQGYLAALEGPEVKALVEALEGHQCKNPMSSCTARKALSQFRAATGGE